MDPVQPAAPAEPVAPPVVTPPETPPAPPAPNADDQEWGAAADDFSADKGVKSPAEPPATPPEPPVEPPKPPEGDQKPPENQPPANETPEQKAEREKKEAEEAAAEQPPDNPATREARNAVLQLSQDRQAMAEDVKEKLFPDMQTELQDADGEPIRTVEDVMKLNNPNTGKAFTAEEATQWLFAATRHLEKQIATTEKKIEKIAEVNVSLKDQADAIKVKYGALLKANPNGIREKLYAAFQKTLKKDPKTGIIIDAPMSMQELYETALAPYAYLAEKLEKEEADRAKNEAEVTRQRTQSDRTDVVPGGKGDTMDSEEKEWSNAAKEYYEI